jgi:hypothetical protein
VDEPLTVKIAGHAGAADVSSVSVYVVEVGDADFNSSLGTGAEVDARGQELEVTLAPGLFNKGAVYELTSLELVGPQGVVAELIGGRDFPRTFFRTRNTDEEPPASAEEAAATARQVVAERERRYAAPLGDPIKPGNAQYRILMFVERMLLTRPLRVPGVQLLPLRVGNDPVGNSSTDEAGIINSVLAQLGWGASVNPTQWAQGNSRERPVMVMHVP